MLRYFVFSVWFICDNSIGNLGILYFFRQPQITSWFFFLIFQITNLHLLHFSSFIKCLLCVPGSVLESETPRIAIKIPFPYWICHSVYLTWFIHMPLQASLILLVTWPYFRIVWIFSWDQQKAIYWVFIHTDHHVFSYYIISFDSYFPKKHFISI